MNHIEIEGENVKSALMYSLKKSQKELQRGSSILNIGCGYCYEALALRQHFHAHVSGIDIDSNSIEFARRINEKENLPRRAIFYNADAKELSRLVDRDFNLIMVRNPTVLEDEQGWLEILEKSFYATELEGMIFSTCMYKEEKEKLEKSIQSSGYRVLLSEENPYAENISDVFKESLRPDNYIILAQKVKRSRNFMDFLESIKGYKKI